MITYIKSLVPTHQFYLTFKNLLTCKILKLHTNSIFNNPPPPYTKSLVSTHQFYLTFKNLLTYKI